MANSIYYYIKFYIEISLDKSVLTIMCHSNINVFNELLKAVSTLYKEFSQCAGQLAECFLKGTWACKEMNRYLLVC